MDVDAGTALKAPGSDDTLAVVGTLHLLGGDGVVEKLRAKGYKVERVCSVCAPEATIGRTRGGPGSAAAVARGHGDRRAAAVLPARCSPPDTGDAELAAGAQIGDDGVHVLGAADDRIDRAGLDAFGAADAVRFDHHRDLRCLVFAARAVEWHRRHAQYIRQRARAGIAAGRAVIDARRATRHGLGIRAAAVVAALPALGLRQQSIEAFGQAGHRSVERRVPACAG